MGSRTQRKDALSTASSECRENRAAQPGGRTKLNVTQRETGQSQKVADFLLGCCDADGFGGWDITDLRSVDDPFAGDMLTITSHVRCYRQDPTAFSLELEFEKLVKH